MSKKANKTMTEEQKVSDSNVEVKDSLSNQTAPTPNTVEVESAAPVTESTTEEVITDGTTDLAPEAPKTTKSTGKKSTTKKTSEKKTASKAAAKDDKASDKPSEKKADKKVEEIIIQYAGTEINANDFVTKVQEIWVSWGHKLSSIKSLKLYIKPEEKAIYFVINEKETGKIDL